MYKVKKCEFVQSEERICNANYRACDVSIRDLLLLSSNTEETKCLNGKMQEKRLLVWHLYL